jgi:hypothetical protein
MCTARNTLAATASLVAILGLLYSPLCVLKCDFSDCSPLPIANLAADSEQPGHCHRSSTEKQSSDQPDRGVPRPVNDSDDCPAHADMTALLSVSIRMPAVTGLSSTLLVDASPSRAHSFEGSAVGSSERRSFRSPPKRAAISVYRI